MPQQFAEQHYPRTVPQSHARKRIPNWRTLLHSKPVMFCSAFAAAVAIAVIVAAITYSADGRVANNTLQFPWSPPSETAWTTEGAYPKLTFFEPTCVAYADDGSGRMFVLERRGTVQMFQDDVEAENTTMVLDISDHTWRTPYEDDGAVTIALHPEFGQADSPNRNYFYLLYTAKIGETRYDRLSRFTLNGNRAGDEFVLIDQLDENLWHNGGGLAFGPDGFLYVGVGDEGTNGDGLKNGQRLDRDLFCGILRIDVDQQGGEVSHPIPRQPETGKTQGYNIPKGNPFVGQPGVLEEFWAHGLRNPFRIAFDEQTGNLWAADVGHLRREEINLIRPGGNYGWSYREGSLPFTESYLRGQKPPGAERNEVDPVWEYPHLNGNNCIIGGMVYRGSKHPELSGKFIYADNGSGRVWALSYDGEHAVTNEELLSLPVSSKTGIASVQPDALGEPLIVILGETGTTSGTIRRIVRAEKNTAASLPAKLSATGLFADVKTLKPNPGVVSYEVNAPQSAGAARIRRWIAVPGDGTDPDPNTDRIEFSEDGAWKFPAGTVFVQHFDLPVFEKPGRSNWRPIETRVLVRHSGRGVYALSYRWNESGDDALLVTEPQSEAFAVPNGKASEQTTWQFLDRQTCLACHNANAGFMLGVNTRQLHNAGDGHSTTDQLRRWSNRNFFHEALSDQQIASATHLVAPADAHASLGDRARSYLDVNCAACHREGGRRANYFAEFHQTADLNQLEKAPLQGDFGIADARIVAPGDPFRSVLYYRMAKLGQGRMPFVGAHELDAKGMMLVREWIKQMDAFDGESLTSKAEDEAIARLTAGSVPQEERRPAIDILLGTTRGAFVLWQAIRDGQIVGPQEQEVIAVASTHESADVRDLFEWFVAPEDRTQRLGDQFDPLEVLQHAGDAERGRELFASEGITCRNCHGVTPEASSLGPNLTGIGRKYSRQELLRHIVQPSAQVDPQYAVWTVETMRGRIHNGIIVRRSEEEILLKDEQNHEQTIATSQIEELHEQRRSLMPDGLLQSLTPTQAADLLAYLQSLQD